MCISTNKTINKIINLVFKFFIISMNFLLKTTDIFHIIHRPNQGQIIREDVYKRQRMVRLKIMKTNKKILLLLPAVVEEKALNKLIEKTLLVVEEIGYLQIIQKELNQVYQKVIITGMKKHKHILISEYHHVVEQILVKVMIIIKQYYKDMVEQVVVV